MIYMGARARLGKGARIRYNVEAVRAWMTDRYKQNAPEPGIRKELAQ